MKNVLRRLLVLAAASTVAAPVSAHHVWFEQDASGARLCFGEFAENLRESSPGLLDRFVQPTAHRATATGEQAVAVTRGAEAFALAASAEKGEALVVEDSRYPVTERKDGEKTVRNAWTPAARFVTDFAARPARLTLDVVPTGKNEAGRYELQVVYKGQPLPKAEVSLLAEFGGGQEHHTDEQGKITITAPWKGSYAVLVRHSDKTPGERPGAQGPESFDSASYATTLTFSQADGLVGPPAPPRVTPKR